MQITRIYGEAQLARALNNTALNVVLYQKCDCTKSKVIREYLEALALDDKYDDVNVIIIDSHKLPETYYQRRGVSRFPVVSYCHGKDEINRMSGYHDLDMLTRGIATSRQKIAA